MEIDSPVDGEEIFNQIINISWDVIMNEASKLRVQHKVSKEEYTETIQQLQKHILCGDCYEINYSMEFFC